MADEAAVLDAPVLDAEPIEQEEPALELEAEEPQAEVTEPEGDGRVEPKWLRNMKATDPEGYKDAKAKFHTLRSLDEKLKDFDLDSAKKFYEEHGTPETILQTLSEREAKAQELDQINTAIEAGDTAILDRLPAESIGKLAPAMAEKWAQADPEGWARSMSGVMAATINQSGIPMFLERMGMLLEFGKTEDVKASIAQLSQWASSFQQKAAAPVTQKPESKGPDVNQERQQWEQEKFNTSLKDDVIKFRSDEIEKALGEYFKRSPKDQDKRDLAMSDVKRKVIEQMSADGDYQSKLNALTGRRDKDGAMRLIRSREAKAIEEIAPKVGRTIFGQPAAAVTAKPAVAARTVVRTPQKPNDKFDAIWGA